jgi:1-acyl-sn-glycerol-3-phosphate acyltransferase
MKPVFQGLFHLLAEVHISGTENLPRQSAYLAAMNHVSTFDPPLALAFWPEMIEALGASDIWKRKGFGQNMLARWYGAIPVQRGAYDRQALERVCHVLRSGYPLLMAPEGGRTHVLAMRRAKPGIAFLLEAAQVPVVPVGIIGTTDDFFQRAIRGQRPRVEMRIGKPFQLPPVTGKGEDRRLARQRNADLVMSAIASLLPEEYRGVYGSGLGA